MPGASEVQHLVLRDANAKPFLLARVMWPDVCQAISAQRPDWKEDPGLFDLPYDPGSELVTIHEATKIATDWGARLPSEGAPTVSGPPMIRRMPANWSNLSPAERRAWGLEFVRIGGTGQHTPVGTDVPNDAVRVRKSWTRRLHWRPGSALHR